MFCSQKIKKRFNPPIFLIGIILIGSLFFSYNLVLAQTASDVEAQKAKLEAELGELEKEIVEKEAVLSTQKIKSVSLERDISILKNQIGSAKLKIKSKNLLIKKLTGEISQKTKKIGELGDKIDREKESLGQLIRKTNEIEENTIVHVVLSKQNLSDFYGDLDSFAFLKEAINESVDELKGAKDNVELEKNSLKQKQDDEIDAKVELERQKKIVEKVESDQNKLLSLSKKKEKEYQNFLKEREKRRAEIRAQLFNLRDTAAIPFGKALEYANLASKATGIRPAFLLAIITQESNLGQNVGTCNRPNDPSEKKWQSIMKPNRDHTPFLRITGSLGYDPNVMPVSCPFGGGWGGAMGPAQFIPSTWEIYQDRVVMATGAKVANPWEPMHAFMASATYLSELGARSQTYTAERTAALKYYAGSGWNKLKNAFYGNQVMSKAEDIQENMIDPLMGV